MIDESPLRIALYQYAARDESPSQRLARLEGAADHAVAQGARLLVTPEVFLSGYAVPHALTRERAEPGDGPFARAVAEIARGHDLAIVHGYPEAADGLVYNSALCIGPDGTPLANHRKMELSGASERAVYAAGEHTTLFELDGHTIAVLICYDVEFPEIVRAQAFSGASAVVVPTALVDAHPFVARHMVPTRAFENGIYVAYVNYAGREGEASYLGESCVIGPGGEECARADAEEQVITAVVDPARIAEARMTLPYLDDAKDLLRKD